MRANPCENMNHRRSNAPVAHCPSCGGVVNEAMRNRSCREAEHAVSRREGSVFCVHCGTRLITP
jgi:uncharacterized Zn finger protein